MKRFVILSLLAVLSVYFSFASEKKSIQGFGVKPEDSPTLNKINLHLFIPKIHSDEDVLRAGNPVDCFNQLLTVIMCKQVFKNKITCNVKEILLIFIHYIPPSELIASELSSSG